ncbi:YceI family protein [Ornithinicoccus halotolerans]|uniref:YceI family protein n=1 Tax=Ornithinicoccus halotolerans TaxID=1748220 RepID=UPI0012975C27|nr:YceI family protein [Ornithinicoccus halotolerans]
MTQQTVSPSQLIPGTWTVDAAHSEVGFTARHMMVTKVRGTFADFSAEVVVGETLADSSVSATVQMASVDTRNTDRDGHLVSPDFFDVETYPTMTFRSAQVTETSMTGDLTIKGVTRPVTFDLEFNGTSDDPWGGVRAGFEATTTINRKDWGLSWNVAVESGGVLVSEKVQIHLDIQLVQPQG